MRKLLVFLWASFSAASIALAQGTAFTYQGCLKNSGQPANGSYDFRFRVALDPLGSSFAGSACFAGGVTVDDGLFTATVDFGAGIFTGSDRWLEVAVRTNGGFSDYTVLTPLQPINPTPYAMFAGLAGNISGSLNPAQLPPSVVTNGGSSVNLAGTFSGDGAGLTNIISSGHGDYLFAYANSGVKNDGTYTTFKYVIGPGTNINFNARGPWSDWGTASSPAGEVFIAAHTGVYWIQFSVFDTYLQGGGYPHFQAMLNGIRIPGSQCTPIAQGSTTTTFIADIKSGDKLGIQCTPYAIQTLGTWNAGYFASLNILRIK